MSEGDHPHQTGEMERFGDELVALEPPGATVIAGIYVNKEGFHGTREENEARDAIDGSVNYSVKHPLDLQGPGDKGAAIDWTHWAAQSGDYRSMAKYGRRLKAAFDARDPRLYGWHEAQGQIDEDKPPEELNFDDWTLGVPSSSHSWHWHFSEHRAFVGSWDNKLCMLSVLSGEPLEDYLARGGKLMTEGGTMDPELIKLLEYMAGRMLAVAYLEPTFSDWTTPSGAKPPELGMKVPYTTWANQVLSELAAIRQAGGGGVDPAKLEAAVRKVLADPAVLTAIGKAVVAENARELTD